MSCNEALDNLLSSLGILSIQPLVHLCKQTDYQSTIFCNVGCIRGHTNRSFPLPIPNLPLVHLCKCFGCPITMRIFIGSNKALLCKMSTTEPIASLLEFFKYSPTCTNYTTVLSAPVPHCQCVDVRNILQRVPQTEAAST